MLQPLEGFDDLGLTFKFEYPNYYCETLLWNNGSFLPATSSQTVHHLSQIPLTEGSILDISPQHIAESSKPKQDISFMNHPAHLGAWKYSNPSLDASFVEGYLFPGIYEEAVDRSPATLFSTPSTPALSLSDSRSSSSSPYIHSSENTVFDREHKGYISQPESGDLTLFLRHHYDGPVATTAPPAQMAELDSPFAIHSPGVHSIPSLRLESSTSPPPPPPRPSSPRHTPPPPPPPPPRSHTIPSSRYLRSPSQPLSAEDEPITTPSLSIHISPRKPHTKQSSSRQSQIRITKSHDSDEYVPLVTATALRKKSCKSYVRQPSPDRICTDPQCHGKVFTRPADVERHHREVHCRGTEDIEKSTCILCLKVFARPDAMLRHLYCPTRRCKSTALRRYCEGDLSADICREHIPGFEKLRRHRYS